MSMPQGTPTSQAIPYFLRAMRTTRPPEWVKTPQGLILRQVESRLQTIFIEERQIESAGQAVEELERIIARIKALAAQAKAKPVRMVQAPAPAPKPAVQPVPKPAAEILKPKAQPKTDMDEAYELMTAAMAQYIESGDVTSVVPNGFFSSDEEAKLWSHFTMAKISQVNGRTLHATKLSNQKPLNAVVMKPGISAEVGKAAILQDDNKLIIAVLPLGAAADQLTATFNAMYRR